MDPYIIAAISFFFNIVFTLVGYLARRAHEDLKENHKQLKDEVNTIKDTYFKKDAFTEFKEELWRRLERMEDDFKTQIRELRK